MRCGVKRLFTEEAAASGFTGVDSRVTKAGDAYTALNPTAFGQGDCSVVDGRESH